MASGFGGGMGRRMAAGEEKFDYRLMNKKIVWRLLREVIPYLLPFLISICLILSVSAFSLARPYIVKTAIDDYITPVIEGKAETEHALAGVSRMSLIFLLLILAEFAFGYLQTYILQSTGKKIIMNLRSRVFNHIQKLPVAWFDKNPVGRIVTRVTNDTEALNEMYTDVVVSFIQDIFVMAGVIVLMLSMHTGLTLISLAVVPLMATAAILFRKTARKVFGTIRTRLAVINAFLAEHISGMKIIQVFNMQKNKMNEFDKVNRDYLEANNRMIAVFGIFRPFMDIISSLSLALLLWAGGGNILSGFMELGTLYAFINYTNRFFQPIMDLTEKYNTMQSSLVSSDRIFSLLDEAAEPGPEGQPVVLDKVNGRIEFKNVWFAYTGENWVLKDVSFVIEPGQSVAFVGATGAGKTSIINLICGFYENQKGEILIDGVNIKQCTKQSLRKNIGLVLQDVFLFSGDIETNIRLFDRNISGEKVREAACLAHADSFIEMLPGGYKSMLTEKGSTLSAGQRQLLSFARALVRQPAILVMDEATSSIDTETESLIQKALEKLMEGRTTIAVAHRLSTIQKADQIIVIHEGRIHEKGTHQELLEQKGLYYNLYRLQYANE